MTGDPSLNFASSRILNVIVSPSGLTVGISVARSGMTSPLLFTRYAAVYSRPTIHDVGRSSDDGEK